MATVYYGVIFEPCPSIKFWPELPLKVTRSERWLSIDVGTPECAALDAELEALKVCTLELRKLSREERVRIIDYLTKRFPKDEE